MCTDAVKIGNFSTRVFTYAGDTAVMSAEFSPYGYNVSSHARTGLLSGLFPSSFPTKIMCTMPPICLPSPS